MEINEKADSGIKKFVPNNWKFILALGKGIRVEINTRSVR